jgi:hypothetical protein
VSSWSQQTTLTGICIQPMLFETQAEFHIVERAGTLKFRKKAGSEV